MHIIILFKIMFTMMWILRGTILCFSREFSCLSVISACAYCSCVKICHKSGEIRETCDAGRTSGEGNEKRSGRLASMDESERENEWLH